jgi:hypothetical protein
MADSCLGIQDQFATRGHTASYPFDGFIRSDQVGATVLMCV